MTDRVKKKKKEKCVLFFGGGESHMCTHVFVNFAKETVKEKMEPARGGIGGLGVWGADDLLPTKGKRMEPVGIGGIGGGGDDISPAPLPTPIVGNFADRAEHVYPAEVDQSAYMSHCFYDPIHERAVLIYENGVVMCLSRRQLLRRDIIVRATDVLHASKTAVVVKREDGPFLWNQMLVHQSIPPDVFLVRGDEDYGGGGGNSFEQSTQLVNHQQEHKMLFPRDTGDIAHVAMVDFWIDRGNQRVAIRFANGKVVCLSVTALCSWFTQITSVFYCMPPGPEWCKNVHALGQFIRTYQLEKEEQHNIYGATTTRIASSRTCL